MKKLDKCAIIVLCIVIIGLLLYNIIPKNYSIIGTWRNDKIDSDIYIRADESITLTLYRSKIDGEYLYNNGVLATKFYKEIDVFTIVFLDENTIKVIRDNGVETIYYRR